MAAIYESGRPAPAVTQGASQPIRRQREIPAAVNDLARLLKAQRLTILALGPLTNMAILVREHPDLISHIEAIVAVGANSLTKCFVWATRLSCISMT
jgi:inosine-uridine nucleoside N-ribohydrolase